MGYDTAFTDEAGQYQVANMEFPKDQAFQLEFKDMDGEINGDYQPLDTIVEFIDPVFSGGGASGWDQGETEMEVNVKLKEKE
jgi:putative lipoprotein (rSAM/lipoprotein system)